MRENFSKLLVALLIVTLLALAGCVKVRRQTTVSGPGGTYINGKPAITAFMCEFCPVGVKNCYARDDEGFWKKCKVRR